MCGGEGGREWAHLGKEAGVAAPSMESSMETKASGSPPSTASTRWISVGEIDATSASADCIYDVYV